MWVQTHQPMPDRPGGAQPQPQPVPFATPPRAAGAAAPAATANTGEPSFAPPSGQPPSAPGSEGTFLFVDDPPAAPGIRDSFASIVDDPFFVRYHTPEPEPGPGPPTALPPPPPPPPSTSAGHRNEERQQPWIPPRKESLSETSLTPWVRTPSRLLCPPSAEGIPPAMQAPVLCLATRPRERERLTIGPV
jgi:hypothetical protein